MPRAARAQRLANGPLRPHRGLRLEVSRARHGRRVVRRGILIVKEGVELLHLGEPLVELHGDRAQRAEHLRRLFRRPAPGAGVRGHADEPRRAGAKRGEVGEERRDEERKGEQGTATRPTCRCQSKGRELARHHAPRTPARDFPCTYRPTSTDALLAPRMKSLAIGAAPAPLDACLWFDDDPTDAPRGATSSSTSLSAQQKA